LKYYLTFLVLIFAMNIYAQEQSPSVKTPIPISIPAEWEEVQAILVSWPFLSHTENNDPAEVHEYYLKYVTVWAKLAEAVQKECSIWIRVYRHEDTLAVKSILNDYKVALTNYKFIVYPGDNFWIRDYGPLCIYYGDRDSIGVIDTRYLKQTTNYFTDALPSHITAVLKAKPFKTKLVYEGGNIKTDGFGNSFFTSEVFRDNTKLNIWPQKTTLDTMRSVFKAGSLTELHALVCDGGTGHIDMFFEMLDEQTIALAEYPDSIHIPDRDILVRNRKILESKLSVYGEPYKIVRMPMPDPANSDFSGTSCKDLNRDPRTYMNGIFVNKSYIVPIFSPDTLINTTDAEAIAVLKKNLPGYTIVPIDSRILSVSMGGIHCITSQIPAENPIRFKMKDVPRSTMPLVETYPISVEITNKDNIKTAQLTTRKRGATWSGQFLKLNQRGSVNLAKTTDKIFHGEIDGSFLTVGDTVDYYFSAESFNGKKMTKPITAPDGYYSFVIVEAAKHQTGELMQVPFFKTEVAENDLKFHIISNKVPELNEAEPARQLFPHDVR